MLLEIDLVLQLCTRCGISIIINQMIECNFTGNLTVEY